MKFIGCRHFRAHLAPVVIALIWFGSVAGQSADALHLANPEHQRKTAVDYGASASSSFTIGTVPRHVLTWAYDRAGHQGSNATAAQVQAFTNWAEDIKKTNSPPDKAERDCYPLAGNAGCQAVAYLQATRLHVSGVYPQQFFIAQLDSERIPGDGGFYHNTRRSSDDRVTNGTVCAAFASPCYFARIADQHVIDFVNRCIIQGGSATSCDNQNFTGYAPGTEFMEDTTAPLCRYAGYGDYFPPRSTTTTPIELGAEPTCDANLQASIETYLAGLHYAGGRAARLFLNGYAPLCPNRGCYFPGSAMTYWTRAPVPALGVVDEGSVCSGSTVPEIGQPGPNALNNMAELFNEARNGYYVFLSYGTLAATQAQILRMRRYCTGIFWLGYNEARSVDWEDMPASKFSLVLAVYPEEQLVPTNPIVTMTDVLSYGSNNGTGCTAAGDDDLNMRGGAQTLLVSGSCSSDGRGNYSGVYVREFRQCYSWGSIIGFGHCSAVVNTTNSAVVIGGSPSKPWTYVDGRRVFTQSYDGLLILSGSDVVTDHCSITAGCSTGRGTDLNFGGSFMLYRTVVAPGDAAFLFYV